MKHRHNAGCGDRFCFHGAFAKKSDAVKKEAKTAGGFLRNLRYGAGDYRYAVMSPRENPRKKKSRKRLRGNPLFTRAEKRRVKKRIKHAVKGAARKGLLSLFGGKRSSAGAPERKHRGTSPAPAGVRGDVISALVNQGYSRAKASSMVPAAAAGDSFDSLFRRAMKRNPKAKKKAHRGGAEARRKRKRNPESASGDHESQQAIKAFRGFHGADPEKVTDVIENMVAQKKFWLLGRLQGYDLHQFPHRNYANGNRRPNVDTWDANVMLCASPPDDPKDKLGRQLFLYGGSQDLEWALKKDFNIHGNVQLVVLGQIDFIYYVTRKSMYNFELDSFIHRFGETLVDNKRVMDPNAEKPLLLYDRLNKKQWIVGGAYTITERGIEL